LVFGISSTIRIGIGKNYEFRLRPKALNFINMWKQIFFRKNWKEN